MNITGIIVLGIAIIIAVFAFSSISLSPFTHGPSAPGASSNRVENPEPGPTSGGGLSNRESDQTRIKPGQSPLAGTVRIDTVNRAETLAEREYIIIRRESGTTGTVDVTGWQIQTPHDTLIIPQAANLPEFDVSPSDIRLPPGGELIALTGSAAYATNFRENGCTGYLAESYEFRPFLSGSCIDDRRERDLLIRRGFNGACIDAIEAVPACHKPGGRALAGDVKPECLTYMDENLNYAGCAGNFRNDPEFFKNIWRVNLRRSAPIYDPRHDRVILRDRAGLLVDEYTY